MRATLLLDASFLMRLKGFDEFLHTEASPPPPEGTLSLIDGLPHLTEKGATLLLAN